MTTDARAETLERMTVLSFLLASAFATTPQDYFGTWKITALKSVTKAVRATPEAWVGKTLTLEKKHVEYGTGFLWFTRKCADPHLRTTPYRQTPNDPTSPSDYGLDRFPHESLVVRCVWPDGHLTPTFSFEIVSKNRLSIYWDGTLLFLERS